MTVASDRSLCDRIGCEGAATVFLLFDPRAADAWLRDIDDDTRTAAISLCVSHANRVTVPNGWTLTDERVPGNRLAPASRAAAAPRAVRTLRLADEPEARAPEVDEPHADEPEADELEARAPEADEAEAEADEAEADEPVVERPTLWSDDESHDPHDDDRTPEPLRVDESTPLLSRAFRAAHID
ncbi:MAG: DUF3499 family protein [Acidimicrobiia bacterium]|nr:DUF3499 family protein [Acidimicrobiia bacterium]